MKLGEILSLFLDVNDYSWYNFFGLLLLLLSLFLLYLCEYSQRMTFLSYFGLPNKIENICVFWMFSHCLLNSLPSLSWHPHLYNYVFMEDDVIYPLPGVNLDYTKPVRKS